MFVCLYSKGNLYIASLKPLLEKLTKLGDMNVKQWKNGLILRKPFFKTIIITAMDSMNGIPIKFIMWEIKLIEI